MKDKQEQKCQLQREKAKRVAEKFSKSRERSPEPKTNIDIE